MVEDRTGHASSAGFLLSAALFPYVVSGPLVGNALDRTRRPRRQVAVLAIAYTVAVALLLTVAGNVPIALALVTAIAVGCVEPVVVAVAGLLPRIVAPDRLTRAYGLESASFNVAGIAGPGVVAGVATWQGPQQAAVVVVAFGVLGALVMLFLAIPAPDTAAPSDPAPGSVPGVVPGPATESVPAVPSVPAPGPAVPDPALPAGWAPDPVTPPVPGARTGPAPMTGVLTGGVVVLFGNRPLRAITVATVLAFAAIGGVPVVAVLLAEHLGADAGVGGHFLVAFAVGALAGSLAAARWSSRRQAEWIVLIGIAALGVSLAGAATATSVYWAIVWFTAAGFWDGPVLAATLTLRQRESPADRLGQVNTTGGSLKIGAAAVGAALTGALADAAGADGLLFGMAALQFAGAAAGLVLLRPRRSPAGNPS
ncbi:MFS transporter [Actinomadura sp. HBU206391]|nr:MFS transporter [Actinomadura sp. HBU206391]